MKSQVDVLRQTIRDKVPHLRDIDRGGSRVLHQFEASGNPFYIVLNYDSGGESFVQIGIGHPDDDGLTGFLRRTCLNEVHKWGDPDLKALLRDAHEAVHHMIIRNTHEQ